MARFSPTAALERVHAFQPLAGSRSLPNQKVAVFICFLAPVAAAAELCATSDAPSDAASDVLLLLEQAESASAKAAAPKKHNNFFFINTILLVFIFWI